METYLKGIACAEKLQLSKSAFDAIVYFARGNIAKAVQTLQLVSLSAQGGEITDEKVFETTIRFRDETINQLLYAALEGDFSKGRKLIDEMIVEKGLLGVEILEGISEALVDSGETEESVARLIIKISETDSLLKDTANERIQLEKLILSFS